LFTGGIDKIEVCVPVTARFTDGFHTMYQEARETGRFATDKQYFSSVDLRPCGVDAILHEDSKYRNRDGNHVHKLELLAVNRLNANQIVQEVRRVFDEFPANMKVYRVDFCVDLPGITIDDLRARLRVKYKRTSRSYGQATQEGEAVLHNVQTIMLGSDDDLLRYYDKTAERRRAYAKQKRLARSQNMKAASFQETFGHDENASITRIERQLRGRSVPDHLNTLENLLLNTPEFNPFAGVEIINGGRQQPRIEDYGVHDYCIGRGIADMVRELGIVETRRRLNKNRNAARLLKKYAEFIPAAGENGFRIPDLAEAFRSAAKEQLTPPSSNIEMSATVSTVKANSAAVI